MIGKGRTSALTPALSPRRRRIAGRVLSVRLRQVGVGIWHG